MHEGKSNGEVTIVNVQVSGCELVCLLIPVLAWINAIVLPEGNGKMTQVSHTHLVHDFGNIKFPFA